MRTSESTATISKKLVGAQADMKNAQLDGENPHFGSRYATLAAIRDATVPALHAHGIAMVQGTNVTDDGRLLAFTRLSYEDEWYESTYPIVIEKPQQMGSAITYAKRYMLAAMCGIVAEEDDDGNAAQQSEHHAHATSSRVIPFSLDHKLGFGKHGSSTWRELAEHRPDYIHWLRDNTERITDDMMAEIEAVMFSEEALDGGDELDLSSPATEEQKEQIVNLRLPLSPLLTDAQKQRINDALNGTEEQAAATIKWLTEKTAEAGEPVGAS